MTIHYTRRDFLFATSPKTAQRNHPVAITKECLAFAGVSCRACEDYCQQRAIRFRATLAQCEQPVILSEKCNQCGECLTACPVNALSLESLPHG